MRERAESTAGGSAAATTAPSTNSPRPTLRPATALESLGLTADDVRLFEQLATLGPATLVEVRAALGARQAPRAALARLVELGLARRLPGRPAQYAAADPRSALANHLVEIAPGRAVPAPSDGSPDRIDDPPTDAASTAGGRGTDGSAPLPDSVAAGLAELALLARSAHSATEDVPGLLIERAETGFEARARLAHVQAAAQSRIRAFAVEGAADPASPTAAHGDLLARGVTCQVLYSRSSLHDDASMRIVETLAAAGQECRVLPTLPHGLYLVDDRWALLPVAESACDGTGVTKPVAGLTVVHPSTLLDALSMLFDNLWRRALPVHAATEPTGGAVRGGSVAQGQQILAMMVSGATDEAIARRLGLSNRTLQRRIAELMDAMGVRTRFQLGIQAALRARGSNGAAGVRSGGADLPG